MTIHSKAFGMAAAIGGTALLALGPGVQSASAATSAPAAFAFPSATFYTGTNLTGTATSVDLSQVGVCKALSQPARSAFNFSVQEIEVYFNPDCKTGTPGKASDISFVLGSLNVGNFPYPAVSYRVRTN
ncbi:hypothetical protein EV644_12781 [Kribbella orskensis]|uniref:Beta/gamma crystallin n=1 Tax=Kribbella orskensis TaxID=2512216 RepID=A0ABY2B921_9ACTN|nr:MULTISPECIES: hypothetical protein [Kribbella]TCN32171.1 hypothetical protein EV642_12881 [Kribbella sp. VKM Ac-2500]TCO12190.1 hypothetical protein EV644_12781 [Kribbella orskensis]